MGKRGKSTNEIIFKEVEKILKEYKHYNTYIRIFELNKKLHADDKEYIKKQDKSIKYYKKMSLNVDRCLQVLSNDELKFINEKYYNKKTYREIIQLLNKIMYGDEFIDKKAQVSFNCLMNNGSVIKRIILTKLLNENILGVDKIC